VEGLEHGDWRVVRSTEDGTWHFVADWFRAAQLVRQSSDKIAKSENYNVALVYRDAG